MLHDSANAGSPAKPGLLTAGFITVMTAVVSAVASGVLWLMSYQQFMAHTRRIEFNDPETASAVSAFDGMVYLVVGLSVALTLGMAAGGILMLYGKNAGRVLVWTFGGISIGWRLCCGVYSAVVLSAVYDYGRRYAAPEGFPMTEMTAAVVLDLASAVISIVAVILIAQSSVNIYFRKLNAEANPPSPYQPIRGYYEPFGAEQIGYDSHSAPAAPWPHGPPPPPGHSPSPADDSVWRPPGSSRDGDAPAGGHPLDPPR